MDKWSFLLFVVNVVLILSICEMNEIVTKIRMQFGNAINQEQTKELKILTWLLILSKTELERR